MDVRQRAPTAGQNHSSRHLQSDPAPSNKKSSPAKKRRNAKEPANIEKYPGISISVLPLGSGITEGNGAGQKEKLDPIGAIWKQPVPRKPGNRVGRVRHQHSQKSNAPYGVDVCEVVDFILGWFHFLKLAISWEKRQLNNVCPQLTRDGCL